MRLLVAEEGIFARVLLVTHRADVLLLCAVFLALVDEQMPIHVLWATERALAHRAGRTVFLSDGRTSRPRGLIGVSYGTAIRLRL